MSKIKTLSATDGGPKTKQSIDKNGNAVITVWARYNGPRAAKIADVLTGISTVFVAAVSLAATVLLTDLSLPGRLAILATPFPAYWAFRTYYYRALSFTKKIVFTPETTSFRSGLRVKHFDNHMPSKFVMYRHKLWDVEAKRMELREAKRTVKWYSRPLKPYFQKTFTISYEYMGQRNDLMSVYTHEKAQEIISRLSAVSELIRSYDNRGGGLAPTPDMDWASQAGALGTDGAQA